MTPVSRRDGARWTPTRRTALTIVANGDLEYATRTGSWEPRVGYRLPAFDWLDEHGYIEADLDAEPVGRVTQRVPVVLTAKGRAELRTQTGHT